MYQWGKGHLFYEKRYGSEANFEALRLIRDALPARLPTAEVGPRWSSLHSWHEPGDGVIVDASRVEHVPTNLAAFSHGPAAAGHARRGAGRPACRVAYHERLRRRAGHER